ncbi:MAG TPA: hypothetical protein VEG39_18870 [Clostridia bacterium]|nr:hypothetical protein [Clostridia bacterium]
MIFKNKGTDVVHMIKKCIHNKKGLTLVEVLLSSALILLVFTGFINAFYYSVNLRVNSQNRLQAMLKAQTCLEELRGSRGEPDDNGEWTELEELEEWLVGEMDYEESSDGVYEKDNIVLTLIDSDTGIPEKLIPVYVEVSYKDQMDKNKVRSVKLQTRLREF